MRMDQKRAKREQGEEESYLYVDGNGSGLSNTDWNTNGTCSTGSSQSGACVQVHGQGYLEQDQVHARRKICDLQTNFRICGVHHLSCTSDRPQQSWHLQTSSFKQRSMENNRRNLREGEHTRQIRSNIRKAHLDMHSVQQVMHMESFCNP